MRIPHAHRFSLFIAIFSAIAAVLLAALGGSATRGPARANAARLTTLGDALSGRAATFGHQARTVRNAPAAIGVDRSVYYPKTVARPATYTVQPGDSLSSIAAKLYGSAADWPALWWSNRSHIANPLAVPAGLVLTLGSNTVTPAMRSAALAAIPKPPPPPAPTPVGTSPGTSNPSPPPVGPPPAPQPNPQPNPPPPSGSGQLSPAQVGGYWLAAGGPAWAEQASEAVAMCESGDNTNAYNPSGATGLFQILGQVVPGNLYDPLVNAENAVSKFTASGDTWSQWVCQP